MQHTTSSNALHF